MRRAWLHFFQFKFFIHTCLVIVFAVSILGALAGCEAFVRKFTRKPKEDKSKQVQMVVAPEEYVAVQMSKEEQYRQYFLYWKSWQDEFIEALKGTNHRKQTNCLKQALNNLEQLRPLLSGQKQQALDEYLKRMQVLQTEVIADIYGTLRVRSRSSAESLKRAILRDLAYPKVKGSLS